MGYTRDLVQATKYGQRRQRTDTSEGSTSSEEKRRDDRLKERGDLGLNVVSFTFTLEQRQWYVVGAYVPPNNQPEIHWVAQALARELAGVGKLLVGNLNACLAQPRNQQEEDLEIIILGHGMSEQQRNFNPRRR